MPPLKVLVLGITGMMGHTLFIHLSGNTDLDVYGSCRNSGSTIAQFYPNLAEKVLTHLNVEDWDSLTETLVDIQPRVVINCIGIIKQLPAAKDALKIIAVNALLPHRLALICRAIGAKLIQISTDCVFSGKKGNYTEDDLPDPVDLYGQTKLLGEVTYPNCLTIRTSIIGHQLTGSHGLVEWFLAQPEQAPGFTGALYSGLTTLELSRVLGEYTLADPDLQGLYQVSADPISKYDLLTLISRIYGKNIPIIPDDKVRIDRSLDSSRFRQKTGYSPPAWPELISQMYQDFTTAPHYRNRPKTLPGA